MWFLKGTLLSMCLFGLATIVYLYFTVFRHLGPHTSVDIRSLFLLTTLNPLWWTMGAVCFVLGLAIAHKMAAFAA
jgi:hypothetical protein